MYVFLYFMSENKTLAEYKAEAEKLATTVKGLQIALNAAKTGKTESLYFINKTGAPKPWHNVSETLRYFESKHPEFCIALESENGRKMTVDEFHKLLSKKLGL